MKHLYSYFLEILKRMLQDFKKIGVKMSPRLMSEECFQSEVFFLRVASTFVSTLSAEKNSIHRKGYISNIISQIR